MILPLRAITPSFAQVKLDFPAHRGFFLIGCSATTIGGKIVSSAWASDHVYNSAEGRYENWVPPPETPFRPGKVMSDRPPYLVHLNDDLSVEQVDDIVIAPSFNRELESIRLRPGGFDGLKPFEWNGQLWCDFYSGGYGDVKFWLGRLNGSTLVNCRRLQLPGPRRDEKNWMPEVVGNDLRYHYKVGVLTDVNGKLTDMGRPDLHNLHGGTQVVDGLAIVHDYRDDGVGRVYRHYFVRFDFYGRPIALSRPFVLTDVERVEVVCGLAKHPDGKRLIISHGPFLATVDKAEIMGMPWDGVPQPVPPYRPPPRTPPRTRPPRVLRVVRGPGSGLSA